METPSSEQPRSLLRSLNRKQIAALVYVIIALGMLTLAVSETSANVGWFAAAYNLNVQVDNPIFHMNSNYPNVTVVASLSNPTGFNGISFSRANLMVFVNSTSEPFVFAGTTEVGAHSTPFGILVPSKGSLNLTSTFPVWSDTAVALRPFLGNHTRTGDLVTYVGVAIYLNSNFGQYKIPYCFQLPQKALTSCPPPRVSGGGING